MPTVIARCAAFGVLLAPVYLVGAPPPPVRDLFRPSKAIVRSAVPGTASPRYVDVDRDAVLALSATPRRIAIDLDAATRLLVDETRAYWSPDGSTLTVRQMQKRWKNAEEMAADLEAKGVSPVLEHVN